MDSTVLGDVVNIASRLEGLTKHYNAKIIVSAQTKGLLGTELEILCRELDYVNVVGKDEPVVIFEIFDADDEEVRESKRRILKTYQKGVENYHVRRWDDALGLFKECLEAFPTDTISRMYADRCLRYKSDPPDESWNGALKWTIK